MIKKFNFGVFLVGIMAAAIPDLLNYLLKALAFNGVIQSQIRYFEEVARIYPWQLFIFAACFGITSFVTDTERRRVGLSGAIQFALLVPVGSWLIKFFLLIAAGALVKYGIGTDISFLVTEITVALLILAVAQGSLGIGVGALGYFAIAAYVAATILVPDKPVNFKVISSFYYTTIGAVLSFYMASYEEKWVRPGE